MKYYVYHLLDSASKLPFYVGKGCGDRMYRHLKNVKKNKLFGNPHLFNKLKKLLNENVNVEYIKVFETDAEIEAYQYEIFEIKRLRNLKINICNITDGGEGGEVFSDTISRSDKISKTLTGRKLSAEHYENTINSRLLANKKWTGQHHTSQSKKLISESKLGDKNPMKRPDVRAKVSKTLRESKKCSGENNSKAIFTREIVFSIRNDWNTTNMTLKQIAEKYKCKRPTIEKIIQNKHYYDPDWIKVDRWSRLTCPLLSVILYHNQGATMNKKLLLTEQAQELLQYFDAMPKYAQGFVTECISTTENLDQAADKFDAEIIDYLKEYRPEHVNEWLDELDELSQQKSLNYDGKNPLTPAQERLEKVGL